MIIKDIVINKFRGFDNRSFAFDRKMNVVLGDNTTGKTTLLHAVQVALGAYLQELTLVTGCARNFWKSDQVSLYSNSTKSFQPHTEKPRIEAIADFVKGTYTIQTQEYKEETKRIRWARTSANQSKNSRKNTGELMDIVAELEQSRRSADATGVIPVFPLFLSFGASRLENKYNGTEKTKARASREERAYKCALDEKVDFKSAFDWIYRYERELTKGNEFEGTDRAFLSALYDAIPALKQIEIDRKNNEFTAAIQMVKDAAPYWLTYDMMSAGFKSMINIASEIAHRCIELNGFLGADAVKKTAGVIMIDEIDLYLHPHWQQHVLEDLQRAFPKMQFIVTTHSPFIVQSVRRENVIALDGNKGDVDPNMRHIEDVISVEMQTEPRNSRYKLMLEKAERYYQLVKACEADTPTAAAIKRELDEIEEEFSDDPAYVSLLRAERSGE